MPTTTNFGWTTPADTDLVKDGASAIRTLGSGIDTSFVDLKGGTTGQVLAKASNTDLDYSWTTVSSGSLTLLASGSLPTNASTLTISSISQDYRDLRIELENARVTTDDSIYIRFNGNTGNAYFLFDFEGSGVSNAAAGTVCRFQGVADSGTSGGYAFATIPDYKSDHWKLVRTAFVVPNATDVTNARGQSYLNGTNITAAITSLTLYSESTNNFAAGTYKLYGVV